MEIWRLLAVSWKAEKLLTYRILWCLLDHSWINSIGFVSEEMFYSTHSLIPLIYFGCQLFRHRMIMLLTHYQGHKRTVLYGSVHTSDLFSHSLIKRLEGIDVREAIDLLK